MKRIILTLSVAALLLVLSACVTVDETTEDGAVDTNEPSTADDDRNDGPNAQIAPDRTQTGTGPGADTPGKVEPVPSAEAYLMPGAIGDGRYILPSGRIISPVGEHVTLDRFPMTVIGHPTLDYIYTIYGVANPELTTIDTSEMTIVDTLQLGSHFGGMAINAAGDTLWVGGGNDDVIYELTLTDGMPTLSRSIPAPGYPTDVKLSADEQYLTASFAFGKKVSVFELASGEEQIIMNAGVYAYNVAVAENTDRVICTNWGTWTVSIFRWSDGALLADLEVGKNPEGVVILPDGETAYVACSDTDEVVEIDLIDLVVNRSIPLYEDTETMGLGAIATELDLAPDGQTLYVTASGFNSVDVIDTTAGQVIGRIPTEWYPTDVLVRGDDLVVLTGNGISVGDDYPTTGDRTTGKGGTYYGSAEVIPIPDAATLTDYTEMVIANNERTSLFYEAGVQFDSPIPSQLGTPSDEIKHIVFILKENKTFDQVLADMPGANGDEGLLVFGDYYTPNLHALAAEFTFSDNYYSESHDSDLGHSWATGVMANDYVEKLFRGDGWLLMTGVEPAAVPASKTVFHKMIEDGISFRVYGEIVGTMSDLNLFAPYMNFNYGFYTHAISDERRAAECIREWEAGIFPQFMFIMLPDDHTEGNTPGAPTVEYFVANNDSGMGMLVDWIVNSEHWPETAIFITQDDPQSGVDHVDPHRTPLVVISPYAKRGHISGVHHSMASLWLTFELLLGMDQVTNYDRFTAPLYDFFTTEQNLTVNYNHIPSNVPYEENPDDLPFAKYCQSENWDVPDQVERISEVIWAKMKPGVPYPWRYALSPEEREDEEEEEAEGQDYRQRMRAYIEYGKKHGLVDPRLDLMKHGLHKSTEK